MQRNGQRVVTGIVCLLLGSLLAALHAQEPPGSLLAALHAQEPPGSRPNSAFRVQFRREWELRLTEPVKLVEVGTVTGDKNNRLVLLVGGKNKDDYKRKLLILRWNGLQFDTEYTTELLGTSLDTLLVGAFQEDKPGTKPAKSKPSPKSTAQQIITTKSVYAYIGNGFTRLCDAPGDLHAALFLDKAPAQLIAGQGDNATPYQLGESSVLPSAVEPPTKGPGYLRFGVGTQEAPLSPFRGSLRYIQSHWTNQNRWLLCLLPGQSASNLPDAPPHATVGDRLVIFAPRLASRDKTFWNTAPDDLEEIWRSDPLPGRVLDVRIGDPKNERQEGILILTAENNDRDRRLHFFTVASGVTLPNR